MRCRDLWEPATLLAVPLQPRSLQLCNLQPVQHNLACCSHVLPPAAACNLASFNLRLEPCAPPPTSPCDITVVWPEASACNLQPMPCNLPCSLATSKGSAALAEGLEVTCKMSEHNKAIAIVCDGPCWWKWSVRGPHLWPHQFCAPQLR